MMMRRRRRRRRRIRRAFGPGRVRSWVCWFVTPLIFPPQWDGGAKIHPSMIVPPCFFAFVGALYVSLVMTCLSGGRDGPK